VRSGSSKRSSTGDFSSELDDYFDNVAHRSLQTAVIEEETTPAEPASVHDAASLVSGRPNHQQPASATSADRRAPRMTGQNSLEHFVDNLINEAAQQSKTEIEQYLLVQSLVPEGPSDSGGGISSVEQGSECTPRLEQYATILASHIITSALEEVVDSDRQKRISSDFVRPSRHATIQRQSTEQHPPRHGRRFDRQHTVSGFRDAVLSDFDRKLINSNIATDAPAVTFANTAAGVSQKRRSSEPASLHYSKNSRSQRSMSPLSTWTSSTVDWRKVISSWFTAPAEDPASGALSGYVQNLVIDAFVGSVAPPPPPSKTVRRHRRRRRKSHDSVPDAISCYADHLTDCILAAVQHQLRTSAVFSAQSTSLQSVAEKFARSIVDDALAVQSASVSSSSQHTLVSLRDVMLSDVTCQFMQCIVVKYLSVCDDSSRTCETKNITIVIVIRVN